MLANISPAALQRIGVFIWNLGLAQITDDLFPRRRKAIHSTFRGKDVGDEGGSFTVACRYCHWRARKLSEELVERRSHRSPIWVAAEPLRQLAIAVRDRV